MVDDLKAKVQAILFVCDRPIEPEKIAQVTGSDILSVKNILKSLINAQNETDGYLLKKVGSEYRYYANPRYNEVVKALLTQESRSQLSLAAYEVLAIIAYLQPITRSRINEIRGVDSDSSIRLLLERDIIRARGRAPLPGNPILYITTEKFLESLGITSLKELPVIEGDKFGVDDFASIKERLSQ